MQDPHKSYKKFIAIITQVYDKFFSKSRVKVRHNKNVGPWITRGIAKSSKRKQKTIFYSKQLIQFQGDAKKRIMKEVIGKARKTQLFFLSKIIANNIKINE